MQRRRHGHVGAPAGHRHFAAASNAPQRLHVHVAPPNLDAAAVRALALDGLHALRVPFRGRAVAARSNGHRVSAFLGGEQNVGPRRLQTPAGAHRAVDAVEEREAAAVEVQPQVARQGELVFGRHGAAAAFHDGHSVARRQPKGRLVRPWRADQQGIHRARGFRRRNAQLRTRLVAPNLRRRHVALRFRHGRAGKHVVGAGANRNQPGAWPDLQPQRAALQSRWQIAPQRHRDEARRQDGAQQFFAHAAGNVDVDVGVEPRRHVVHHQPKDLHGQRILGARLGTPGAQPQAVVAPRQRHGNAVHGQGDQADFGGNGELRRTLPPSKATADAVLAYGQARGWPFVSQHQRRGPSIDRHVPGPVLGAPRQRHPLLAAVDRPALFEPAAFGSDVDGEAPRPGAGEVGWIHGGAVVEERAVPVLVAVQHPIAPTVQGFRHVNGVCALRAQREPKGAHSRRSQPGDSHGQALGTAG